MKLTKRMKAVTSLVDKSKEYSISDGVALVKKASKAKFDESVDVAVRLGVDPKKSDQMVRGTVVLPHGTGKKVRIAVFCKGEHEQLAKGAKADYVGGEDLISKVSGGFLDFE